jgi:hypothetical protein
MNTNTLAAGVIGFLLGGLVVSTAAWLEDDRPTRPSHGSSRHGAALSGKPHASSMIAPAHVVSPSDLPSPGL